MAQQTRSSGLSIGVWLVAICAVAASPLAALALVPVLDQTAALRWTLAAAAMVGALAVALLLGRAIRRGVARVTGTAVAIERGESADCGVSAIRELNDLARAVEDAGRARLDAEAQLSEAARRLTVLVDRAPDAIVCVDRKRQVIVFNRAAATLFGCAADAALGAPVDRFVSHDFRRMLDARLDQAGTRSLHANAGTVVAGVGFRHDGNEFALEASLSAIPIRNEALCMLILHDVTERKRRDDATAQTLEQEKTARAEAEAVVGRAALLVEVQRELLVAADASAVASAVARVVTGPLADWCAVDLVAESGAVRRAAEAGAEPGRDGPPRGGRSHGRGEARENPGAP